MEAPVPSPTGGVPPPLRPPSSHTQSQSHPPRPNPPPTSLSGEAAATSSVEQQQAWQQHQHQHQNQQHQHHHHHHQQQQHQHQHQQHQHHHQQQQQQKMSAAGGGTKKRKMMTGGDHHHHRHHPQQQQRLQNSSYLKIRTAVKDLRPTFLEVVHAADFRDCKAAHDIRKKMKTILELCKQLRVEISLPATEQKQSSTGEYTQVSMDRQEALDTKPAAGPPHQPSSIPSKQDGQGPKPQLPSADASEAKVKTKDPEQPRGQGLKGSFVIGGSPIGWNFIVFSSGEPVYYGPTKASRRAKDPADP